VGALVAGVVATLAGSVPVCADPFGLVAANLAPPPGGPVRATGDGLSPEAARAREAIAERAWSQAASRLVRAVLVAPDDVQARLALGACLLASGSAEAAWGQLDRVAAACPADGRVALLVASAEAALGRTAEALERLESVLARRPDWAAAHARCGAILAEAGDEEGARAAFARVERAALANPRDLVEAANHHLEAGRPREALGPLQRALRLRPDDSWAANNMGNAYRALGDAAHARASYERAAAADPTNPNPLNGLGALLEAQGAVRAALRAYRHAVAIDGRYFEARYNMGVLLLREGRPAEARRQLEAAAALQPELAAVHYQLGEATVRLGDVEAARAHCRHALELDPGLRVASELLRRLEGRRRR
jgi:tetratricopeptide (TPR) repeat protein